MGTVSSDDYDIHFLENGGSGSAAVFVHGSCGAGSQWTALANGFGDMIHTYQIDLPGCGKNKPWNPMEKWIPAVDTQAIESLLLHIDREVHFILHSAGGHLAFDSLKRNKKQLKSLTMFEPTYFNLLQEYSNPNFSQPNDMAKTFQRFMDKENIDAAMESFVDVWAKCPGTWSGMPEALKASMKRTANRLYFEWNQIYGDSPTLADLRELDVPMLLVKGTETIDSMHAVCEIMKSGVPDAQYLEVEGAGHMCPFTHADVVAPNVLAFLSKHE